MKKGIKTNIRAEICIFAVVMLFLSFTNLPFHGLFDDLVAAVLAAPMLIGIINKKFTRVEIRMLIALMFTCIIGLVSNFYANVVTNISYIINDLLSFIRIFVVYFGVVALLRGKPWAIQHTINRLGFYSKVFITIAFSFGILNAFGIVKMYSTVRYGFKNYFFFFGNASQFGVYAGCALALLILSGKSKQIYELLALMCLIMTFKGMGLIIVAVYIILCFAVKKKIKWWHWTIAICILFFVLRFQITSYLLDKTAPRAILIYYGFVTAFRFFPFGSGFASYGSNMAAVHYSPLYYDYSFHLRKALTIFDDGYGATTYLNDAYLGMIVGQFGIIGLLLVVYSFLKLGKGILKNKNAESKAKFITIACFCCFCGMAVMAGSIKTAGGEMLMVIFAVYEVVSESKKQFDDRIIKKEIGGI